MLKVNSANLVSIPEKNNNTKNIGIMKYSTAGIIGAGVGALIPIKSKPTNADDTVLRAGNHLVKAKRLKPNKPPKGMFALIGMVVGLCAMKIYDYFSKNKA